MGMEPGWRTRLRRLMEDRSLNAAELGRMANMNSRIVYDLLEKVGNPRLDTLRSIADALGVSVNYLADGSDGYHQRIPITGAVSAGEAWIDADDVIGEVEMSLSGGDVIALEVKGESMSPVYRDGDIIVGVKQAGVTAHNLLGQDCIVVTEDGARFVKYLAKSAIRGRFNLRSYNPANPDIADVRIAWAAPIIWVRKAGR